MVDRTDDVLQFRFNCSNDVNDLFLSVVITCFELGVRTVMLYYSYVKESEKHV